MSAETVFESAQAFIARHLDGTPAEVWDSWQIAWHGVDYGPARDALPGCLADLWHCEREFRGALETAVYAHAVAEPAWRGEPEILAEVSADNVEVLR